MTRINPKFTRIYGNGYDLSCIASNIGTVGYNTEAPSVSAYCDEVMNTVLGNSNIVAGPVNGFLAPSATTGFHERLSGGNAIMDFMVAFGDSGLPEVGDPVFAWKMQQAGYMSESGGVMAVNVTLSNSAKTASITYDNPFGFLAHAKGAETAVNTGVAVIDAGASTTKGGVFVYQLFSSNGTVTLSLDEASTNTNPNFAALTGATSGSINASVTPKSGFVALSKTATVKRYIRWQLAFGTATTATFACAFLRSV